MRSRSGFTLIETLVTGVLATIVGAALVSVLTMVNTQIKEGIADSRLGRMQVTVSEQIRAQTRKSWGILLTTDDTGPDFEYSDLGPIEGSREILVCNKNGDPFAKYRFTDDGILEEWYAGDDGDYYPFRVGDEIVRVDPSKSGFSIANGRKSLKFTLAYRLTDQNKTLPAIEESALCRNLSN